MSYKYDASDASGLVKEGDYEAVIERMEVKTIPSGKNKLSVAFRIRDDVDQAYKNKWIFKDIWPEKDNPEFFNRKQINQLLGTQVIEDGTEFPSINDIIKFLENATLIIHISIEFNEYRGEDVNTISYYKKTKIVPQQVGGVEEEHKDVPPMPAPITPKVAEPVTEGVVADLPDDDLPF
jgi:hypothetical protein